VLKCHLASRRLPEAIKNWFAKIGRFGASSVGRLNRMFFAEPVTFSLALLAPDRQNTVLVAVAESKSFMSIKSLIGFTRCSLIVPETRVVAAMLLEGISKQEWQRQIVELNVLQKRTAKTAITYAGTARSRLETMHPDLWVLVRDESLPVATQAVLAATVKFSPLLGDFLRTVVRDQFRRFSTHLEPRHWNAFLEDGLQVDLDAPTFSASTQVKLRQNAMRMLRPVSLRTLVACGCAVSILSLLFPIFYISTTNDTCLIVSRCVREQP